MAARTPAGLGLQGFDSVGDVSGEGRWESGYSYEYLEADAVIAVLTDSEFGGGGTDAKGHVFEAAYRPADRWSLAFTRFLNERGADAGHARDYNQLQAGTPSATERPQSARG